MRRWRRLWLGIAAALALAIAAGQRFGDPVLSPQDGEPTVTVEVVDFGYHAALFLPRDILLTAAAGQGARRLAAVALRFEAYPVLELGWGDESFYRATPTIGDLDPVLGTRAILGLNDTTVLHVVGRQGLPDARVGEGARAVVILSARAFERLIPPIEATLAGTDAPQEIGTGLYGPSLFYRASGHYSALNVCNHWLARLMLAAGRSINLTLATSSRLLVWQLR